MPEGDMGEIKKQDGVTYLVEQTDDGENWFALPKVEAAPFTLADRERAQVLAGGAVKAAHELHMEPAGFAYFLMRYEHELSAAVYDLAVIKAMLQGVEDVKDLDTIIGVVKRAILRAGKHTPKEDDHG